MDLVDEDDGGAEEKGEGEEEEDNNGDMLKVAGGVLEGWGWKEGTGGRYHQDTLCTHGIVKEYINNK